MEKHGERQEEKDRTMRELKKGWKKKKSATVETNDCVHNGFPTQCWWMCCLQKFFKDCGIPFQTKTIVLTHGSWF